MAVVLGLETHCRRHCRYNATNRKLKLVCRTKFEKRIEAKNKKELQTTQIDVRSKHKNRWNSRQDANKNKAEVDKAKVSSMDKSAKGKQKEDRSNADKRASAVEKGPNAMGRDSNAQSTSTQSPVDNEKKIIVEKAQPKSKLRFDRDFGFGEQGPQVEKLQKLLVVDGRLKRSQVTGYFGRETKDALIRWQRDNRIMQSGYFGPVSRSAFNRQNALIQFQQACSMQMKLKPLQTTGFTLSLFAIVASSLYCYKYQDSLPEWIQKVWNNRQSDPYEDIDYTDEVTSFSPNDILVSERNLDENLSGRPEYERRVELRRNIASLENALGQTEDKLRKAVWQLKREKERADRAESLYLEQKSTFQKLEIEIERLRAELRVSRRSFQTGKTL